MTVEFHIPSRVSVDHRRRITAYRIVWIHPAYNADFCEFCHETPGDLPNFYVDDLSMWLEEFQSVGVSP